MSSQKRFSSIVWRSCVWTSLTFCVGCSSSPPPAPSLVQYKNWDEIKQRLEEVASTGEGGSSLWTLQVSIEAMQQQEPEKTKQLLAKFQQLEMTLDLPGRKQIAREMADLLK